MISVHYRQALPTELPQGQTGEWVAAVLPGCVLLVKYSSVLGGHASGSPDGLWRGLASANGVQDTLDTLTSNGLSATPPFALVQWGTESTPGPIRAILRGAITLTVHTEDGVSTTDASTAATWLELQFPLVRKFDLVVGSGTEGLADGLTDGTSLRLPLGSGVVVTSQVSVDLVVCSTPAAAGEAPQRAMPTLATVTTPPATLSDVPAAAPVAWVDPEATVTGLPAVSEVEPIDASNAASSVESGEKSAYDYLFGETMFRGVGDAAMHDDPEQDGEPVSPEVAIVGSIPPTPTDFDNDSDRNDNDDSSGGRNTGDHNTGDHDGHTVASADIAKLRASRKARASSTPTPVEVPKTPQLFLERGDGTREPLSEPILVGRSPTVSKMSGGVIPRLVVASGEDQDISRNHAQFTVEGGTVVVTDLHSRNGTLIILPGRSPQQLRQGEPTSVIVGTVIDLGGGVSFTVREE